LILERLNLDRNSRRDIVRERNQRKNTACAGWKSLNTRIPESIVDAYKRSWKSVEEGEVIQIVDDGDEVLSVELYDSRAEAVVDWFRLRRGRIIASANVMITRMLGKGTNVEAQLP
jgi:hypothetical protein